MTHNEGSRERFINGENLGGGTDSRDENLGGGEIHKMEKLRGVVHKWRSQVELGGDGPCVEMQPIVLGVVQDAHS